MLSQNGKTVYILSYSSEGSQTYHKRSLSICPLSIIYGRVSQCDGTSNLVHGSGFMAEREGGSQDAIGMAYPGPSDSDHFLIEFTCAAEDEILRKAFGKEWDEWARIELCQEFIDAERV